MEIRKAIITAAGPNQRTLPLQSMVARDGKTKSALTILIEEVVAAGVEEICVVVSPGDQASYTAAAGAHTGRLQFVQQTQPLGFGHAVACARDFVAKDPFLLLVGDHLYVSRGQVNCAQQLIEAARIESCSLSAVQATHESKLPYYGAVGGQLVAGRTGLYCIEHVLEKPSPTEAEQSLVVPGLRSGYYLCFFGMHVLLPSVMDILTELLAQASNPPSVTLSLALARLAESQRYLALELQGRRFDIGARYGLLTAQLALALEGKDRDEVLAMLVELLALRS